MPKPRVKLLNGEIRSVDLVGGYRIAVVVNRREVYVGPPNEASWDFANSVFRYYLRRLEDGL
jgi:hypothetical protein